MVTWLIIIVAVYLLVAVCGGLERIVNALDDIAQRHHRGGR